MVTGGTCAALSSSSNTCVRRFVLLSRTRTDENKHWDDHVVFTYLARLMAKLYGFRDRRPGGRPAFGGIWDEIHGWIVRDYVQVSCCLATNAIFPVVCLVRAGWLMQPYVVPRWSPRGLTIMAAFRGSCFALCAAKKMLRDWVSQGAPPLHPVVHAVHSPPLLFFW